MSKKLTIAFAALFFAGSGYSLGMSGNSQCEEECKGHSNAANCMRRCIGLKQNEYAKCIAKNPNGKKDGTCPKFRP